jgi:hypothetical protein
MSYPPSTQSLLARLDSAGKQFIDEPGHTPLHRVARANAAAGIVAAAAALETVAKLETLDETASTLGTQLAQGQAAGARLEARVAVLEKRADTLAHGLERVRARDHQYAHALRHAHALLGAWQDKHKGSGPALALRLADASEFWLARAPRILEQVDPAGETVAQRIDKIRAASAGFGGLVGAAADYAARCGLDDFAPDPGASLQLDAGLHADATEQELRQKIAETAGLALWLFAMVALVAPPSVPTGPAAAGTPPPDKARSARSAA